MVYKKMAELTDDIVRRGLTDHLITEFPTFFKYSRNLQKIKHFLKNSNFMENQ